jgi:hypothetical protein
VVAVVLGARPRPEVDESMSVDVGETGLLGSPIDRIGKCGPTDDVISSASIARCNAVPSLRRRRPGSSGGPSHYRRTRAPCASSAASRITRVIHSGRASGRPSPDPGEAVSPGAVATLPPIPRLRTLAAGGHAIEMMSDFRLPGALSSESPPRPDPAHNRRSLLVTDLRAPSDGRPSLGHSLGQRDLRRTRLTVTAGVAGWLRIEQIGLGTLIGGGLGVVAEVERAETERLFERRAHVVFCLATKSRSAARSL